LSARPPAPAGDARGGVLSSGGDAAGSSTNLAAESRAPGRDEKTIVPDSLRVLLVDDSADDRALALRALSKEFPGLVPHEAASAADLDRALRGEPFDLVIGDYALGWTTGLEVLRSVRARWPHAPVVMLTGTGSEEIAVDGLKAGLDDYVLKSPKGLARLALAVRGAIEQAGRRRRSEQLASRLHGILNRLSVGVYRTSLDGRILEASPGVAHLLGRRTVDDLRSLNVTETFVRREDRERIVAALKEKGQIRKFEAQLRRADGSTLWAAFTESLIVTEDGEVAIEGLMEDVSERRRAAEALERRDKILAAVGFAAERFITAPRWEDRMQEVLARLGASAQVSRAYIFQVVGQREGRGVITQRFEWSAPGVSAEIDNPEMQNFTLAEVALGAWEPALRSGEPVCAHVRDLPPYAREFLGAQQILSLLCVPIFVDAEWWGFIGCDECFAERDWSAAEMDALKAAAAILSAAIRRQRAEEALLSSDAQLQQAQKMEAVGRLAGGVAHDFNNLLTVISGYCGLMMAQLSKDDPFYHQAEEMSRAAERAASLTRQLLAFSRRQVIQPAVLDLNALLADMEKMLRRLIGEDVDLVASFEPALGRVKADPGQLEQVVLNLAVNARDAMPQGGRLSIRTANVQLDADDAARPADVKPGSYVMLALADTGTGMDPAVLSRIFEPFFTTKEKGKGTGLGLSTVYGIVKQSGGHVAVESAPGRGSTFRVYLPRVEEDVGPPPPPPPPLRRGTETILLVEDEDMLRGLVREMLRKAGYLVLEARQGGEALLHCERHAGTIHMMLSDVVMPQMSGPELAERLRRLRPGMKVLFMSGYTDEAIVHHGVLRPGVAFVHKPFTAEGLAAKIQEVLDSGPGA
jgi:PAS domain S-box-containing protein